jgi:hypothetical protein
MPEENEFYKRLILADGTVLNNCECGYYEKTLWCYINKDIPLLSVFQYFSDIDKYNMIIFEFGTDSVAKRITYTGFDEFKTLDITEDNYAVRLTGPKIDKEEENIFGSSEGGE